MSASAQAETMETVQVVAKKTGSALMESHEQIQARLNSVPGGTNLVDLADATKLSSLSDALNYQPGIIVQEFFGGLDQPRLNVRGSGIQGNPVSRGVLLRQNYLPLNDADGSFIVGLLNLRNSQTITVHRGANSRVPGSFTLGGDMNFITRQQGNRVHFEKGSFGQQALQMSYGADTADTDGSQEWLTFVDFVEEKAEGYRHHSASSRTQGSVSIAARLNETIHNTTHINYTEMAFEMPFVLPKGTAKSNPTWVFGDGVPIGFTLPADELEFVNLTNVANTVMNMYRRDPHRATDHIRLANRTTISLNQTDHTVGWYLQSTDDAFVDPFTHIETQTDTLGAQWVIDGYPTGYLHYQVGVDYNTSDMPRSYTGNHPLQGSKIGKPYSDLDLTAENQAISFLMDLQLTPEIKLIGQYQWGKAQRQGTDEAHPNNPNLNLSWAFTLPKLGLVYEPSEPRQRWFFNISKSIELPTFWELVAVDLNPLLTWMSQATLTPIEPQKANSVELGGEFGLSDHGNIQITVYRSQIEKELISTASQFGVLAQTSNYENNTIHQGIEAGFSYLSPLSHSDIQWRGSWTYSDFYFKDGVYKGNQIAGVPQNVIMLEALWQNHQFKAGPNVRWVPDDNPVDHKNTLGQGAYALLGMSLHYYFDPYLHTFLVIDNLTDEIYNSSYVVRAESNELLPTFLPDNGRSVSAGVRLHF